MLLADTPNLLLLGVCGVAVWTCPGAGVLCLMLSVPVDSGVIDAFSLVCERHALPRPAVVVCDCTCVKQSVATFLPGRRLVGAASP